jgi:hypothetical protein
MPATYGEKQVPLRGCVVARRSDFIRQLPRETQYPCSIADELPNGYQSALVVVIVVAVMPDDYHVVVVAAVVAVIPIWLRKSAGGEEHKQDKY